MIQNASLIDCDLYVALWKRAKKHHFNPIYFISIAKNEKHGSFIRMLFHIDKDQIIVALIQWWYIVNITWKHHLLD